MLLALLFGALTALLLWDYWHKRHRVDTFARGGISGPLALPLLGCGLDALKIGAETLIPYIGECFRRYGKTFRLWILNEAQIYTMDVRHFEAVLSSTTLLEKGELYDLLRPWLRDGLLLSVGRKWHARRKIFTPAFHFKVLEHYVGVFDAQAGIMVEELARHADGATVVDMFGQVCLAALDVITEAAMGVKVNAQRDPDFPYVRALKRVVYTQPNRMLKFNQRVDWLFRLTSPTAYRQVQADIQVMHDFTIAVIEERRAALQRSMADGTYKPIIMADGDIGSKDQMALLDILLRASIDGQPLSNEDIREEVDTFMFEGDDTTTSGTSHTLHCISRHPEVQERLFAEILSVIGPDREAPVTMKQLQELKYMDCVIKETLRMYPPVPAIGRKTHKDIEINGTVIPANTSIYLVTIWAHRDPTHFPDPDTFKPERFAGEDDEDGNGTRRDPFAYTPFSAGPKNCIGQKFAMLEMKALVSKVLRYYELLPLGRDAEPMMNFILRSPHGVNVGLRPRVYKTA